MLGSATIFGILTDLDLQVGKDLSRYSLATAAFYYGVSTIRRRVRPGAIDAHPPSPSIALPRSAQPPSQYIVGVIPAALLSQRLKVTRFLGASIILWGAICLLTPAITSWRGLVVQRVFLGLVESTVSPGFLLVTRQWYTSQEMPMRIGIWYSATGFFSVLSGLINYGLGTSTHSIPTWKTLFLVPGSLTVFFGIALLLLLPPSPTERPLLKIPGYNVFSEQEVELILEKTREEMLSREQSKWNWSQVVEALLDVKVWIFTFMATAIYVVNGGVTAFGPIIIRSIGYTPTKAILLQTPGGAVTVVAILVVAFVSLRFKNARLILLCLGCLPVLIGAAMIWGSSWSNKAVPLVGYWLLPAFGAPYVMLLSLVGANVAGSTKSAYASGAVFVGYNAGNIAAAYILKPTEAARHYPTTWAIITAMMLVTMALAGLLAGIMAWENRKRDREGHTTKSQIEQLGGMAEDPVGRVQDDLASEESLKMHIELDQKDLTDKQNRAFRYVF